MIQVLRSHHGLLGRGSTSIINKQEHHAIITKNTSLLFMNHIPAYCINPSVKLPQQAAKEYFTDNSGKIANKICII